MKNRNNKISEFFDSVADIYDEVHPLHIEGGLQSKIDTVKYVPKNAKKILNLGAGTGLELEFIFKENKNATIDCVDISQKMLNKLQEKYNLKQVNTFCQDYFKFKFEKGRYDCVISIMSFHHFLPKEKIKLYRLIFNSLTSKGVFVYSDYCAKDLKEEKSFREKLKNLAIKNCPEGSYDIPTYPQTDISLLKTAGFLIAEIKWQTEHNVCLIAKK